VDEKEIESSKAIVSLVGGAPKPKFEAERSPRLSSIVIPYLFGLRKPPLPLFILPSPTSKLKATAA
jgi:hypothetical protein